MLKLYLTIALSLLCFIDIQAQKLNVESFVAKSNDITARTQPRKDINGNDCALIKVQLAASGAVFEGNVIGNVAYNTSEYLVYMAQGSKKLTVKLGGYLPLEVSFQDYDVKSLEPKTVYLLTISGVMNGKAQEPVRTKTGWIILDSEPSGASVYINDEFVGNTPLNNYKQAYGTYQYRLEHPNYHSSSGTINLNAGRYEDKIVMKPAFGSVDVKSSVVGAEVLLDGKTTGKRTPCTLSEVASGRHTITLRLNKYAPQQQEVTVEDGQTAQVSVSMDARFASVTINSLQGAQIYCNGKVIGTGRCTEDMMEGYYDLEARLDHHKPVTKQIQVVAGQSQEISLNPTPIYGSLDIISTPRDATITIDGKKVGKTPFTINELLEGEHTVQLTLDNYQTETKKITITENKAESLQISLNNYNSQYCFDLGLKSYNSKDYNQAAKWFLKAAEQGYAEAQSCLAGMYYYGEGVKKDYKEAVIWYRKAAEQGYAKAQYNLATQYYFGEGVKIDYKEAVIWYRKAAEQGHTLAQDNLGYMYSKGQGVPQNYAESVKWHRKAAEQGHANAQYNLALRYYYGQGVPQNQTEAVKWYRKAAEQGHASAQYNLASLYFKGEGVKKDNKKALKWFRKAAEQGEDNAKEIVELLEKLR